MGPYFGNYKGDRQVVAVGCGWLVVRRLRFNVECYYIASNPLGCLVGFYFELSAAEAGLRAWLPASYL
jgi:hypothetical protein